MLKLDEIEGEDASRRTRRTEEKRSKGHRKSRRASGGQKSRSSMEAVPFQVEPPREEETPLDLLYPSGMSCKVEPSASSEDNYILMPPLEVLEDAEVKVEELLEQSVHNISKNQKNGRWIHSYNKMIYLRKCAANGDRSTQDNTSQSSSEEHERIPKIEDITYVDSGKRQDKRQDKKWTKKFNPLSLHYTDKKRPYLKCPACGATFFSPNTYQRHLLSHLRTTAESNYMCNFCDYSNAEPGMLFAHLTKHQNQCESCNESLLRKVNYDKHHQCSTSLLSSLKRDHHGMFACVVCELVFDLLAQLEKHWFKHTCKKQKSYQCNECSGIYENVETLKNHICLKCPICGDVYENLHRLKIHTMWTKHNLKCPICSYEFILSMDYEKHMALHRKVYQPMKDYTHCLRADDDKTFQCNLCDKIFYALSALRKHLREEHSGNVKVEEEIIEDDGYELKENAIVVVPEFKDSDNYYDNEIDPLQQETDLYDPLKS